MTCRAIQSLLLAAEDPAQPPAEVRAHLAHCVACRAWQRRLARLEHHVPLLPVPLPTGRDRFVEGFMAGPAAEGEDRAAAAPTGGPRARRLGRRSFTAAVVAAGVAAFLLGGLAGLGLRGSRETPQAEAPARVGEERDEFLAGLLHRHVRLAVAESPRARVEELAALADDLRKETQELAAAAEAEDLLKLAGLYERVVREGLVPRARDLPPDQRRPVLTPVAEQLEQARRRAEELAEALPAAAEPLHLVAAVAREGGDQLRALTRVEADAGPRPAPWDDRRALVREGRP